MAIKTASNILQKIEKAAGLHHSTHNHLHLNTGENNNKFDNLSVDQLKAIKDIMNKGKGDDTINIEG